MSYQKQKERIKPTWDDSRLGWLACSWFPKFGPKSLEKLHTYFGDQGGQKAFEASSADLEKAGIIQASINDFSEWKKNKQPQSLKEILDKDGIDFILKSDKDYPAPLRNSSCPPAILFWRGAEWDNRPWIACVGTRRMTNYGAQVAKIIAGDLAAMGAGIVSGMALGIDAATHQACIDNGGRTVAVLGSGSDNATIYPQANLNLSERILLSGGALISEFPPGTKGFKSNFPQRNRIIATLAQATVVIEAGESSGSVLTAKIALDENRDVFAVPGPITSLVSQGVNNLLRQGAQVCTCAKDVLQSQDSQTQEMSLPRLLTTDETHILDLCRNPSSPDDLVQLLNLSPAVVSSTCTELELMGTIQDTGNRLYQLTSLGRNTLNIQR